MNWTPETDAMVIQMATEGLGDTAMSRRFLSAHGLVVSRNAIIGRRHRLRAAGKLPGAVPKPRAPAAPKAQRHHPFRPQTESPPKRAPIDRQLAVVKIREKLFPGIRASTDPVTIFDLGPLPPNAERCRWPLGETMAKAELFCGAPITEPDPVYCPQHTAEVSGGTPRRY